MDKPETKLYRYNPKVNRRSIVKYTQKERLEIGRQIYTGEISRSEAAEKYDIHADTARCYMRLYRDMNHLPPKRGKKNVYRPSTLATCTADLKKIESMTREELIDALVMARINEARLKKGYMVKGVGVAKEYLPIVSKNTR